jgi:hypothetical protein
MNGRCPRCPGYCPGLSHLDDTAPERPRDRALWQRRAVANHRLQPGARVGNRTPWTTLRGSAVTITRGQVWRPSGSFTRPPVDSWRALVRPSPVVSRAARGNTIQDLAPKAGFEPAPVELTARRSTVRLPRNGRPPVRPGRPSKSRSLVKDRGSWELRSVETLGFEPRLDGIRTRCPTVGPRLVASGGCAGDRTQT